MEKDSQEILLTQWQTCVEMANSVSERRDTMNNLFVTLNIAIIAATTIVWDIKTILLSVAGIVLCIVWLMFLRNFRHLNAEKYRVITQIEDHLPVQAFANEWKGIKHNNKYIEGTKLERVFPTVFTVVYVAIISVLLILYYKK